MAAQNIKSLSITNLDTAGPAPIANLAGAGAPAYVRAISDSCALTTAGEASTSSTYKMVRVQSDVILKNIKLLTSATLDTGGGSASLTFDIGAYYSDSTVDGTAVANQGVLISATAFATAVVSPLAGVPTSVTWNSTFLANEVTPGPFMNSPLWEALGLATDPGGYIDIVVAVHAAANTAAAGSLWLEASFSE